MALTSTTLSGALTAAGTRANLASATGVAAGSLMKIDDEFVRVAAIAGTWVDLIRGINGSVQCAHNTGAPVCHSLSGDDFSAPLPAPRMYSYTSAGALTVAPGVHLVGVGAGGAIAYTLANPGADQNGILLHVVSMSAYAHTITLATGWGAVSGDTDVITLSGAVGDGFTLISRAGTWAPVATALTAAEGASAAVA